MQCRTRGHSLTARKRLVVLTSILTVVVVCSNSGAGADGRPLRTATQLGAPPEIRGQVNAWPLPDHDYLNSRDAGVSPIRLSTVTRLLPAWSVPMSVGASTSPIIAAGVAYVQDQAGTVYAIDVSSGQVS